MDMSNRNVEYDICKFKSNLVYTLSTGYHHTHNFLKKGIKKKIIYFSRVDIGGGESRSVVEERVVAEGREEAGRWLRWGKSGPWRLYKRRYGPLCAFM